MKLLFDENLPPKLARLLASSFPGSEAIRECGLRGRPDEEIWSHARANDFILISKDSDFQQRSLLYGHPPKVIWLRVGNCNCDVLLQLILRHEPAIRQFARDFRQSLLILS